MSDATPLNKKKKNDMIMLFQKISDLASLFVEVTWFLLLNEKF